MHHGGNTDAADHRELLRIFLLKIRFQLRKAGLQTRLRVRKGICPYAINELVFPCVAAGGDRNIAFIQQNSLDARGAEFDTKHGFA